MSDDSAGEGVCCRAICMGILDGFVRDMVD